MKLPKAQDHRTGFNWAWAYYDRREDADAVIAAMRAGRNRKWGRGRCDGPTYVEDAGMWCVHYHCDNEVDPPIDYDEARRRREGNGAAMSRGN